MDEARKMVYQFLSPPHHVQVGVLRGLSLMEFDDNKLPESELWVACFRRAKEQGKVEQLRGAIGEAAANLAQR